MNKYKVVVYAIAKNEEKFVKRWYNSMKEADCIYVLDTGSTDNTVKLLKELGVNVKKEKINPWRFDIARNMSLDLVPKDVDICVCTDLDEVFNKGWRKKLEKIWNENNINQLGYNYNWYIKNKKPIVNFYIEKIHSRNNFIWTHPVHEILKYTGNNLRKINTNLITLNHYPDKKKSRSSYLKLLELSVKEDPNDDRNMHYLGREYMYYKEYHKCIDTLIKHLNLKSSTWKDERSASMRFIARSYTLLNRPLEAEMWLNLSIKETPYLRDPYIEKALFKYNQNEYQEVIDLCLKALNINNKYKTYINEQFSYNETPYDLLSLSYFYLNDYHNSLKYIDIAIKMNPTNKRILNNKKIIQNIINK